MTPMPVYVQTAKAAPVQQQTSRPFVLPPADRNTEAATAYLLHRGISPKVLLYCGGDVYKRHGLRWFSFYPRRLFGLQLQ